MKMSLRIAVILLTILGCVGCDQITKSVAREYLPSREPVSLFSDVVRLQHTENPGAFLSLGDSLPRNTRLVLFTLGGTTLVIGMAFWACRSRRLSPVQVVGAALACGGGLSNLIDRLIQNGHVTDFINIGVGPIRTGIFNCADMSLMFGLAMLLAGDSVLEWLSARR